MNHWVELTDGRWCNLAHVAQIGQINGDATHTVYGVDHDRIGAISGRKDIEDLTAAIIPAAVGTEVIVVWWDKWSSQPKFHTARRAVIAWRISDLLASPVLAGEAISEKGGQTFLLAHPDGTFEWPFVGLFDSVEEAVAEIKDQHRGTVSRPTPRCGRRRPDT
jgi:hypothetical protein